MHGFEDGALVANVAGGGQAQSANQAGAHVGEDVTVEIGHDEDFVVVGCRIRDDFQAGVVEQLGIEFDVGEIFADLPGDVEEETVGHFHNGGFVHGADFALAHVFGVLKGEAQHALRGCPGYEFDGLHDAVNHHVLDAGVLAFRVFTDEHGVDVVVGGFVACN